MNKETLDELTRIVREESVLAIVKGYNNRSIKLSYVLRILQTDSDIESLLSEEDFELINDLINKEHMLKDVVNRITLENIHDRLENVKELMREKVQLSKERKELIDDFINLFSEYNM